MLCTTHLEDDHQLILRSLRILDEMTERCEQCRRISAEDADRLVQFLKGFADRFHQGKEEGVLFPALLKDPSQKHHMDLAADIFQHDRQRSLIDGLEESVHTGNVNEFIYFSRRLSLFLRDHIQDEEQDLFELIKSVLSPEEDKAVNAGMQRYELLWQNVNLQRLIQSLMDLETQYLPKSAA